MQVSVITPAFNAVDHIRACIDSVRAQGDAVLEHIIADGGSRDGTVELVESAARADPRIRLLPGPDQGQSDALNKGSAAATGGVIGILNADDTYEPGAVREALAFLAARARPTFVAGNCLIHRPDDLLRNRPSDLRLEALLLDWDYAQFPANPAAYFYHRQVHDIVGGYAVAEHYAMDIDFILKCARQVDMAYVDRLWGHFYLAPGCKTYDDTQGDERRKAVIARHVATLPPHQRRKMARIKRRIDAVRLARRVLKRSSLLRRAHARATEHDSGFAST
jgi:glycosyltransferase involved in cell wall biosynthesis